MCPYLGPVTCDHALPIEVLSLRLLASHADFLRRSSRNHSSVTNPQRTSALEAICLSFSAKKHKTSNCWSQVYRAVQAWENNQHFPTCHFRVTLQSVFSGYNFSGLPASSSISSSRWSQLRENTRVSKVARPFYPPPPFLALASFRVPFARSVKATIYTHQLKTLL